jgi:predicted metal-dependent hydrolase
MPTFDYQIIRSNRKSTRLQVKDREVLVKTGFKTSIKHVEQLLIEHADWINQQLAKQDSNLIYLFGQAYEKVIINSPIISYELVGSQCIMRFTDECQSKQLIKQLYMDQAKYLKALITACSNEFGIQPRTVTIKHLTRTLGICHRDRSISIAWQVVKYPTAFIRMVIFHELCHLVHMNHSEDFYALLSEYVPNYRELKKLTKHIT